MAKLSLVICHLLALVVNVALAGNSFTVKGRIYCDTCRAGFETSATEYIGEAKARIECKSFNTSEVTQNVEGTADRDGYYTIVIKDVHDDDICEAVLVWSPRADCNELPKGRDRARIVLNQSTGMTTTERTANSLGFLKETPLPLCGELLQQYALSDDLDG